VSSWSGSNFNPSEGGIEGEYEPRSFQNSTLSGNFQWSDLPTSQSSFPIAPVSLGRSRRGRGARGRSAAVPISSQHGRLALDPNAAPFQLEDLDDSFERNPHQLRDDDDDSSTSMSTSVCNDTDPISFRTSASPEKSPTPPCDNSNPTAKERSSPFFSTKEKSPTPPPTSHKVELPSAKSPPPGEHHPHLLSSMSSAWEKYNDDVDAELPSRRVNQKQVKVRNSAEPRKEKEKKKDECQRINDIQVPESQPAENARKQERRRRDRQVKVELPVSTTSASSALSSPQSVSDDQGSTPGAAKAAISPPSIVNVVTRTAPETPAEAAPVPRGGIFDRAEIQAIPDVSIFRKPSGSQLSTTFDVRGHRQHRPRVRMVGGWSDDGNDNAPSPSMALTDVFHVITSAPYSPDVLPGDNVHRAHGGHRNRSFHRTDRRESRAMENYVPVHVELPIQQPRPTSVVVKK
jgi:hypothetical protein